jgi:ElaB/YqjD/DUF883 family membrane-anchored ribosome-binding protein
MQMTARNVEGEFDTLKDDLGKLRADVSNLSSALKDVTSDTVREQVEIIRARIDSIAADAKMQGRASLDDLTGRIEERPLASVLIAFGVGVLIGKLFDR